MNRPAWLVANLAALLLALAAPSGAMAEDNTSSQVAFSVSGGELTYSLSDGAMAPVTFVYTGSDETTATGSITLTVSDARGTFEGWSIAIESTPFTYTGRASGTHDIPAARAAIAPQEPILTVGPDLDGVHAAPSGSLASRRTVIVADPGAGSGAYSQELLIHLDIPAGSPAGTYTALLTLSASAAPSGSD